MAGDQIPRLGELLGRQVGEAALLARPEGQDVVGPMLLPGPADAALLAALPVPEEQRAAELLAQPQQRPNHQPLLGQPLADAEPESFGVGHLSRSGSYSKT